MVSTTEHINWIYFVKASHFGQSSGCRKYPPKFIRYPPVAFWNAVRVSARHVTRLGLAGLHSGLKLVLHQPIRVHDYFLNKLLWYRSIVFAAYNSCSGAHFLRCVCKCKWIVAGGFVSTGEIIIRFKVA